MKEAFERSDALQRQVKEYRASLEVATAQRDKLQASVATREARDGASATAIREKDEKIFGLSRELTAWQSRVPPLVERFRTRDLEAQALEVELKQARERVVALESVTGPDHTRIEPVDPNTLADGLSASNDPLDTLTSQFDNELVDQDDSFIEAFATVDETPPDSDASAATDAATGISDAELGAISDTFSGIFDGPEQPDEDHPADVPASEPDAVVNDSKVAESNTDDLKLIKGVGPVIERILNDLGIYRFNQIAEMSEFDIDRVAHQLKGFRSRIYREDWVGQARNLQHQKNTDPA